MKKNLLNLFNGSFGVFFVIFILVLGLATFYVMYLGFAFYVGTTGAVIILLIGFLLGFLLGEGIDYLIAVVGVVLWIVSMFSTPQKSTVEVDKSTAIIASSTPQKSTVETVNSTTIASSAPQELIIIDSAKIPENTYLTPTSNPSEQLQQLPRPSNSFDSRSLNAEGLRLSVQGNIEQALLAFEQAAQLNPNDSEILGNLAYSHYQLGHYQPAEQVLYRALSIKPKRGSSWLLVGQLSSVRGDLNGAVEALDKYLYFSSRKNAAVEQLNEWASGYGDGANFPTLRQAAAQSLANAGYR